MKLIPSESGLANNVEKREFSVENTCHKLPQYITNINLIENYQKESSERETCLWKKPDVLGDVEINNYINNLKQMGYREDQALLALQCNDHDVSSALADISQYRPRIGLFELDVVATAEKISRIMINIRKNSLKRKRCFRQIHSKFPNYTMGELLHFYMSNKLKIKRRLARYKKQYNKLSKIPSEEQYDEIVAKLKEVASSRTVSSDTEVKMIENREVVYVDVAKAANDLCGPPDEIWNRQEVFSFFQALGMFGENFLMISRYVGNKTENMVKSFYAQNVKNVL